VLVLLGVLAYVLLSRFTTGNLAWLIGLVLVVSGAFSLFEANRGWCAARALGFKTKY
jgi:hypothetical protein